MPRHKKPDSKKMPARIPFVMDTARKTSYEWAASVVEAESLSAWIRQVLDAEVARLKKSHR